MKLYSKEESVNKNVGIKITNFNMDELHSNLLIKPTILNSPEEITQGTNIKSQLLNNISGNVLDSVPKCQCATDKTGLKYAHNLGVECPRCKTKVEYRGNAPLNYLLFLRLPDGIIKLINPMVWEVLNKYLKNALYFIVSPYHRAERKVEENVLQIVNLVLSDFNLDKGWNVLINNFRVLIKTINERQNRGKTRYEERVAVEQYMNNITDEEIFCTYLPIPNNILFVLEQDGDGIYRSQGHTSAMLELVNEFKLLPSSGDTYKVIPESESRKINNKMLKIYKLYNKYIKEIHTNIIGKKEGLIRKETMGVRAAFTFRTVITQIIGKHKHNHIHIPWTVGIEIFKVELLRDLINVYGMKPHEAKIYMDKHTRVYSERINNIFQNILKSAVQYGGIPTLMVRNPSLYKMSGQVITITRIKTDMTDKTTSISHHSLYGLNGDFDGDQVTFLRITNSMMLQLLAPKKLSSSVLSLNEYGTFGQSLGIPKAAIQQAFNWVNTVRNKY